MINYVTIKLIAIATMIIDHIGILTNNMGYRCIGRISYPIYAYLVVNGYKHTANKYRYVCRLLIMAGISEPIYDLFHFGELINGSAQNIFITLGLGLLGVIIYDKTKSKIMIIGMCVLGQLLRCDYGFFGILLIWQIHISKSKGMIIGNMVVNEYVYALISQNYLQLFSLMSIPILFNYNDTYIKIPKCCRYIFYFVYPVHLLILYLIKTLYF